MSGFPAPGSPAQSNLLGTLRSWLRTWPRESGPSSEGPLADTGGPDTHNRGSVRVLVVDDNPVNLMVMSAMLESRGLVPLLAADGAEAVALASELHFDLILMDLQMPILDGLGAASAIRHVESTLSRPAVPIVAYSSTCLSTGLLATHGIGGCLSKPCEDQDLEDCLVQWCPAYRVAAAECGIAHDCPAWQVPNRSRDAASVPLR